MLSGKLGIAEYSLNITDNNNLLNIESWKNPWFDEWCRLENQVKKC